MKPFSLVSLFLCLSCFLQGQSAPRRVNSNLPRITVHESKRFLQTSDGKPFFYLADTAWELFHRLDRKEAVVYLENRKALGYNVIQAVALAELDGVTDPNAYGDLPLVDKDPSLPALTQGASFTDSRQYDYWDHVDYVIDQANSRGLYIALLPSWGRWVNKNVRSNDESLLTASNAATYGEFLGRRYRNRGIIWVLGGDRSPSGFEAVWRELAKGIAIGVTGKEDYSGVLMTFHPRGGETSSTAFHDDEWLDFNMHQTGHGRADDVKPWERILKDYERANVKPVLDGEPLYEDHPIGFRAKDYGYSFDAHVRQRAWWDVLSGGCGHTYGNHSVWQMYDTGKKPVNGPLLGWDDAIKRPGAAQMQFVKAVIESRPYFSRVPAPGMIDDALSGSERIAASRGEGYAIIYSGAGRPFKVNFEGLSGETLQAWWVNPRTGEALKGEKFSKTATREFTCPSEGFGSDWVLVLDDVSKGFQAPGKVRKPMAAIER